MVQKQKKLKKKNKEGLNLKYKFDAVKTKNEIVQWIREWFEKNGKGCNAVVGISGGKDSTVVAGLCVEALGKDRVIGVLMPNGRQEDIKDSYDVVNHFGIKYYLANISNLSMMLSGILLNTIAKDVRVSEQTLQNAPPRLRMTVLYAISQSVNGRVANTCNFSETMVGWETKWGDAVGDFAPLAELTATEVVKIGEALNIPEYLIKKSPSDGLCGKTDEDAFGFTYKELDTFLRTGNIDNDKNKEKIMKMIKNSEFKRKPIEKYNMEESKQENDTLHHFK